MAGRQGSNEDGLRYCIADCTTVGATDPNPVAAPFKCVQVKTHTGSSSDETSSNVNNKLYSKLAAAHEGDIFKLSAYDYS
jgi:hypothetical protein